MGKPPVPPKPTTELPCKHPRVRIVARDPEEDVAYVECQECGEVFDSHEFQDMEIEEKDRKLASANSIEPEP